MLNKYKFKFGSLLSVGRLRQIFCMYHMLENNCARQSWCWHNLKAVLACQHTISYTQTSTTAASILSPHVQACYNQYQIYGLLANLCGFASLIWPVPITTMLTQLPKGIIELIFQSWQFRREMVVLNVWKAMPGSVNIMKFVLHMTVRQVKTSSSISTGWMANQFLSDDKHNNHVVERWYTQHSYCWLCKTSQ